MKAGAKKRGGPRKGVLRPGAVKQAVAFSKSKRKCEALEVVWAVDWGKAWELFMSRTEDGGWQFGSARELALHLAIGKDAATRERRAGYLHAAIGPPSMASHRQSLIANIPHFGDWNAQRAKGFLGELRSNNILFGSPTMKAARDALRQQMDIMAVGRGGAEQVWMFMARYQLWAQQVDEYFDYKFVDPALSDKQNDERIARYAKWMDYLRTSMTSTIGEIMAKCFGVDAQNQKVLLQLVVAALASQTGDERSNMILRGMMADAQPTIDAATGQPAEDPFQANATLKLLMGSFLEKSASFGMPHPDVHIDGVPEVDDQEKPIEIMKRRMQQLVSDDKPDKPNGKANGQKVSGHGTVKNVN